jgi:hypothetical protein
MCGVWSSGVNPVVAIDSLFLYPFGSALCYFINLQDVRRYASFSDMLTAESLAKVLPGVETIEEGDNFYFIGFLCLFGDTIYAFRHRSRLLWSMARKMLHFTTVYMYISEIWEIKFVLEVKNVLVTILRIKTFLCIIIVIIKTITIHR